MRNVIVLEHLSLDGILQARGGPDEDPSGNFMDGGWIAPYADTWQSSDFSANDLSDHVGEWQTLVC